MSLQNPKSEIYFMTVPFSSDYKHVVDFPNRNAQISAFKNLSTKHVEQMNYIKKNQPLKISGDYGIFEEYNYVMYRNIDVSNKWYFAFIKSLTYDSANCTIINIETDIWQTYQFDVHYYKSWIERAHVSVEDDVIGKWDAPEPIGTNEYVTVKKKDTELNWNPAWNLQTLSVFGIEGSSGNIIEDFLNEGKISFSYGGFNVANNEATGGYFWPISLLDKGSYQTLEQKLNFIISIYNNENLAAGTFKQSHLDEIINLTCVPTWVENHCVNTGAIQLATTAEEKMYIKNPLIRKVVIFNNYNPESLACGYTPKNKKMFTSLAKAIILKNNNGLNIPMKPELFASGITTGEQKPAISFYMRPLNSNSIKIIIDNYFDEFSFSIPYGASLGIGYNSNQGLANFVNKVSAIGGAIGGVAASAAGLATGNLPLAAVGLATTATTAGGSISNAFDSEYKQIGSCSDITSVDAEFIEPCFYEKSPTYDEAVRIDEYLTTYGYAIQEVRGVYGWMKTRSVWNYIQTSNVNLKFYGAENDANIFKNILNSGVTIWHGLENYGDYTKDNV